MYHLHCLQPFTTINCTVHVHGRRPRPVKTYERTVEESTALAATSSSCVISRISLCTTGSCGADNPRILRTSLQCIMRNFCHQSWGPIITLWGWKKLPNLHLGQHTPQRPSNNPPILLCNLQKIPSLNNSCVNDGIIYTKTPKHQPDSRHLISHSDPSSLKLSSPKSNNTRQMCRLMHTPQCNFNIFQGTRQLLFFYLPSEIFFISNLN